MVRILAGALAAFLLALPIAWALPKLWLLPPRLTNNNWSGEIRYRSADNRHIVACVFVTHDTLPYWEASWERGPEWGYWADEAVCQKLPNSLHEGVPPEVVRVSIDGRTVELRAPFFWSRLF